jgi:hypothetical protein
MPCNKLYCPIYIKFSTSYIMNTKQIYASYMTVIIYILLIHVAKMNLRKVSVTSAQTQAVCLWLFHMEQTDSIQLSHMFIKTI